MGMRGEKRERKGESQGRIIVKVGRVGFFGEGKGIFKNFARSRIVKGGTVAWLEG